MSRREATRPPRAWPALALAGLLLGPEPAAAHAFLRHASPAVGSAVHPAPTEVAIEFTEGVEPRFSSIVVQDAAGVRVDRGAAHLAGGEARLAVALGPLTPGSYSVTWHAVATDTHKTQGRFGFTVKP